jgi:ribosomal protein RSM22 (predicted rRNA methylase)
MAPSRSTVGKLQRDQAKRAKAKAKQEDRQARRSDRGDDEPAAARVQEDQGKLLEEFARLHEDLEEGRISLDDFEVRQADLRERLQVD